MKKASLPKKIIILVLVLAVPGFLYYLLTVGGKNRYKPLPVFGEKQVAKTTHKVKGKDIPDTIYHKLPDFNLTDQNGNKVDLSTFNNKIFVINFFYTACPSVCKLMNENVNALDSIYSRNKMIYFVSVTVDPKNDDIAGLKQYASTFKHLSAKRLFLTGDTATIYNLARKGLLVDAIQAGPKDFIYSDKLVLIDGEKRIRGYYTGAQTAEVDRLNDEIKVLISDELRKNDTPLY
ncbi:SCO family protein [Mucilaginibacter sp. L3T2-6]|uniref:SCO family protein n=1 Tax=Mucilaginibacter sp. L3T2-6 TaxID=3062491 RepID=UPI002674C90F|nr:SCO family protein [Mucilaginibacter sp. L3T2-6]MDO3640504.1 SCO family protein [Mucilaginibacter sp. L3T2-6]MDV6213157.1 SCO family protein [Mucilaginibacter sp. L3T2-6]